MIASTRQWLRKNRSKFAIGFGVVGVGYVAGQYAISKFLEARERFAADQRARENLKRRFQQNQDDSTITVLELLPTITEQIMAELPAENVIEQLQRRRGDKVDRSTTPSEVPPSELSSTRLSANEEEGKSSASDCFIRASQVTSSSSDGFERNLSKPKTKAQLWNELKIISITRALTLIYSTSLLSLFTRTQLNLLGRKSYSANLAEQAFDHAKSPTISLENREDESGSFSHAVDYDTNRNYLTFTWWLLHRGWKSLNASVETAVKDVFGAVRPNESITLEKVSSLILEVRRKIEGSETPERRYKDPFASRTTLIEGSPQNWLPFLLPPKAEEAQVLYDSGINPPSKKVNVQREEAAIRPSIDLPRSDAVSAPALRHLLDETADVIESPMFNQVLTLLLDAAFSHLIQERIGPEAYNLEPLQANNGLQNTGANGGVANPTAKLATTLAIMTKEAHQIGHGLPNDYVQALENVQDLEAFAAVIYSSNHERSPSEDDDEDWTFDVEEPQSAVNKTSSEDLSLDLVGKATNAVDAVWSGFESIWTKVTS